MDLVHRSPAEHLLLRSAAAITMELLLLSISVRNSRGMWKLMSRLRPESPLIYPAKVAVWRASTSCILHPR